MDIQKTTTMPEVQDTIVMIRHLSADEKVREEARYREKRLHDEANALGGARKEGVVEGIEIGRAEERKAIAEKMRSRGMNEEQINAILS